ncbi:conserved protein of unknown function [Oenococcus oeni]|uniref:bacteriocin immunity protein n=1 Tax=Oenococcus oeni TaxID=1247 RepID=UPI001078E6EB|nr:bacteriocin immunity protein [Oenococcus oeni]AVI93651.1 hypothetical protein AX764_01710 [Oenococcus oeni]SYV98920.1 conserved hypothetical protein [Oenococcus oeni]SYW01059.1 conserved hypothetical protein [Oenococcus oeni]SYW18437.1 conserved hypothetical protein [Oenococcus oeni]VDC14074.1 conserved protein of unknown function [Oenococcus oeni]
MKSSDKKQNLQRKLESIRPNKAGEKQILNLAVSRLKKGARDQVVLKDLKQQLRKLALEKKLSKETLDLFTEMERPNFSKDLATSSTTWF